MKTVFEFPEFASAVKFQDELKAERDALEKERIELLAALAYDNPGRQQAADSIDQAAAVLAGNRLPVNATELKDDQRKRELDIRQRIEILNRALLKTPELIEKQRGLASRERRKELSAEFAKVSKNYHEAVRLLTAVVAAEDALIANMIEGGFGFREPEFTAPFWLNREVLKEER